MAKRSELTGALAAYVNSKLQESRDAWQLEMRRMVDCIRTQRGMPLEVVTDEDPEVDAASAINYPMIPAVVKAMVAVIKDVFGTAIDAPFTCVPTSQPELPPDVQNWLMGLLANNVDQLTAVTGGDPNQVKQAIDGMLEAAKEQIAERARDAANNIQDEVKERLYMGGWSQEFKEFLVNMVIYPIAIIKAPFLAPRRVRGWDPNTNSLYFEDEQVWCVENINPFRFYPAPQARDARSCEYVIEVRRLTAVDFARLGLVQGYDVKAITGCQEDNPDGHTIPFWTGMDLDPDRDLLQFMGKATMQGTGAYDVACFHGRIPGRMLNAFGDFGLLEYEWYEAEVEVCGDYVIRAALNVQPSGLRPFYTASFEMIPGSIYGESVPTRLFDTQRCMEATVRELLRNMAFSSGPIGEVDISRLAPDESGDFIEPRCIKQVQPGMSGDNAPAFRFHDIESNVEQLQNVLEYFKQQAYELIGFSQLSLGGTPEGSIGRTSGGMSMVMNQSSKPLKDIIGNIGQYIITPVVQSFLDILLMVNPDPTIQGDIRVHPKGIDGLVDDQQLSQDILMAMQNLAPVSQAVQSGSPVAQEMLSLYYYWAKLNNIPTEGMQNLGLQQAFSQSTGQAYQAGPQGAGGQGGQINPAAPPQQPLDNRSAAAAGAITQSNNLPATMGRS